MTAPDHMSETFKNCLHETGHPHMGPPANRGGSDRSALRGNRSHVVLGAAGVRPNHHAKGRRMGSLSEKAANQIIDLVA